MSVARVTEITASSTKSFEDALNVGIARACETLKNVEGAWVQDQKDRKSTRLNSSHPRLSRMPSSA